MFGQSPHRLPEPLRALERYRGIAGDWPGFVEAMIRPLPAVVWANTTRIEPAALAALLREEGLAPEPLGWYPGAFRLAPGRRPGGRWWYLAGLAHAQEESSLLPVVLLDPRPGHRVLDLCAAPGGKTAQIALALGNRGTVVANDISAERGRALRGNLERLGVVNVSTTRWDGANLPPEVGLFDRVLVDAPCSGEGMLRRAGARAGLVDEQVSAGLARRQRALLRKAVQRCRPGGRIVYSTCTFAPEENELVVEAVLREFPHSLRVRPARVPGLATRAGVTQWGGRRLDPALAHCLRLWPQDNDTGGFFAAVLEKHGETERTVEAAPAEPPQAADAGPWLAALERRFGLPAGLWAGYRIHRRTRRGLHLMAADHRPPARPDPEGSGLFMLSTAARPAKLTTAAAMLLGPRARCNRLELDAAEVQAYLDRRDLPLDAQRSAELEPGYVLVGHRGHVLGVGVFHPRSRTLESLFPRRWPGRDGVS